MIKKKVEKRWRAGEWGGGDGTNGISVIIPALNECKNLEFLLPKIKKFSNDIIVIDGHSNDNTKFICQKHKVRFELDNKLGKGDALRLGAHLAKYDFLVFFDADCSHIPMSIKVLHGIFKKDPKIDLIICSRKKGGSFDLTANLSFIGFLRSAGCDLLSLIFNKFYNTKFSDVLNGLRGLKKKQFLRLNTKENGFGIELETLIKSVKKKLNIIEVPNTEKARKFGVSKLNTFFGIYLIIILIKSKFI
jgi:glycosyltransferase involved in cell wall biosynthesis